jgi:hypothetical protein
MIHQGRLVGVFLSWVIDIEDSNPLPKGRTKEVAAVTRHGIAVDTVTHAISTATTTDPKVDRVGPSVIDVYS